MADTREWQDKQPTEKHRETAREVVMGWATSDGLVGLEDRVATALAKAEREGMKRAAEIAKREGVYPELNIFGGGPEWYQHGQRIASAILSEAGEGLSYSQSGLTYSDARGA